MELPQGIPGMLFLTSMPGRGGTLAQDLELMQAHGIDRVVNLTPDDECARISPDYHQSLTCSQIGWDSIHLPIPVNSIPPDRQLLVRTVDDLATRLQAGERILIHCSGGVGRSGSVAICVLLCLGLDQMEASIRVADAGSGLESPEQEVLIEFMAQYWNQSGTPA